MESLIAHTPSKWLGSAADPLLLVLWTLGYLPPNGLSQFTRFQLSRVVRKVPWKPVRAGEAMRRVAAMMQGVCNNSRHIVSVAVALGVLREHVHRMVCHRKWVAGSAKPE